jgi:hypothetical protein
MISPRPLRGRISWTRSRGFSGAKSGPLRRGTWTRPRGVRERLESAGAHRPSTVDGFASPYGWFPGLFGTASLPLISSVSLGITRIYRGLARIFGIARSGFKSRRGRYIPQGFFGRETATPSERLQFLPPRVGFRWRGSPREQRDVAPTRVK